jgi:hypothetical protein
MGGGYAFSASLYSFIHSFIRSKDPHVATQLTDGDFNVHTRLCKP